MKIGIDISQTVYQGTGVASYTKKLVQNLLKADKKNEYTLFFSSLRRKSPDFVGLLSHPHLKVKTFRIPPVILDFLWNKQHIFPIECFIGKVDVFISSDWTQPPAKKAKLVTIVHDLTPWRFPETFDKKIIDVHKRRMRWVKKECDLIICDSKATKKDLVKFLDITERKMKIIYPGTEIFQEIEAPRAKSPSAFREGGLKTKC